MEIFKVGDEVSISGYKAITLSDDMQQNVSKFAEVNGVELSEAEKILSAVPGIKEFAASIYTDDIEDDIVITDEDFKLEDNSFDVAKVQATEKVSATAAPQKTGAIELADDVVVATPSSDNPADLKDLLGIFGFSAATEIPESDLIKQGNKITGFKLDGKSYTVKVDAKGIITETCITDADGNVTKGTYPKDERALLVMELEQAEEDMFSVILPMIREASFGLTAEDEEIIKQAIIGCIEDYRNGTSIDNMAEYLKLHIAQKGYDVSVMNKEFKQKTSRLFQIREICEKICTTVDKIVAFDKEEAKYDTKSTSIGGMNFKIKYLKGKGSCEITEGKDGSININGKNCTIDVLGYGENGKNVVINGENVKFNSNAVTTDTITNNAKNSTINGSFGNDNIQNNPNADNCVINAGDADDIIVNYGKNARLNGEGGNDTIVNYGDDATIDGGDGDDSINYAEGTVKEIIPSEGDDTEHIIKMKGFPSDDPDYKLFREFTVDGVTFRAYSNEDNFDTVKTSFYKNLVTINASNMKIVVIKANDNSAVKMEGSDIKFYSNVTLKSVFNYADNSKINGSTGDDYLYNYSQNSELQGGDGDDALINAGDKARIDGGSGADRIYNRDSGTNSTIVNDSKDKIYNGDPKTSQVISKGSKSDKDYNMEVTMAYITSALRGNPDPSAPDASSTVISDAKKLVSKLIETDKDGKKEFTALARQLIQAARELNKNITDSVQLLEIGLGTIDTDKNGSITEAELKAYEEANDEKLKEQQVKAEVTKLGDEIKDKVGLSTTQIESFINSCGSTADALNKLKQIKVLIEVGQAKDTWGNFMSNVKEMMTSSITDFNNEILADAQILADAENAPEGKDAYIKSKMITDGSEMSLTELASKTKTGEVAEKDGKLYVNDSGKMVELKMSAETYLELFPPVERFFVQQNGLEDCFFAATTLIDSMENPAARAKLLQMFKEDSNGDMTVTFPGVSSYPVTFKGGELKAIDGKYKNGSSTENVGTNHATDTCKGLAMLEQAYALAKFAQVSNSGLSAKDIKEDYSEALSKAISASGKVTNASDVDMDMAIQYWVNGGYGHEVLDDLYGKKSSDQTIGIQGKTDYSVMSTLYSQLQTNNMVMTTVIYDTPKVSQEDKDKYGLSNSHQYAIESINPKDKTVTIKNPYDSYKTVDVPFDVFFKYFNRINTKMLD